MYLSAAGIALSTTALVRALMPGTHVGFSVASVVALPVQPFLVSSSNSAAAEVRSAPSAHNVTL